MDEDLRRLLDERAIHAVLLRYCRGVDRLDLELVRTCYHPDATDSHGSFSGGVDEFLAWVGRLLPRYTTTMHYLANVLVELDPERPGRARSESYGAALHRTDGGPPSGNLVTGFRYVDDFQRRDGDWRIARRVATTEWVRVLRADGDWPIPPGMVVGRRDRTDPVYAPWPDS